MTHRQLHRRRHDLRPLRQRRDRGGRRRCPGVTAVDVDLASGGLTVTSDAARRRRRRARRRRGGRLRGWPAAEPARHDRGTTTHRRRARHRRDDLRLVRRADREEAQPARRRHRHGQLRHREGPGHASARRRHHRRPRRHRREDRLHRRACPARRPSSTEARARRRAAAAAGCWSSRGARPCRSSLLAMVPALQFAGLAVAVAGAGHPRRRLGRRAVPPRGLDQPAARRRDHGHAGLARHARRLRLVAVRAVPARRHAGMRPFELTGRHAAASTSRPPPG